MPATFTISADGRTAENAVWSYETPYPAVAAIKEHLAFYPNRVDEINGGLAALNNPTSNNSVRPRESGGPVFMTGCSKDWVPAFAGTNGARSAATPQSFSMHPRALEEFVAVG